jgi:uncharacterized protein YcgL (UPF0745 family)
MCNNNSMNDITPIKNMQFKDIDEQVWRKFKALCIIYNVHMNDVLYAFMKKQAHLEKLPDDLSIPMRS